MQTPRVVTFLVASALLFCGPLIAQNTTDEPPLAANRVNSGFQIFGGLGLPMGNFSDSDNGAAKTGFALGAQYTISLGNAGPLFKNSGVVFSGAYTNNGTDLGVLNAFGLNFESGSYSNIWALGGLKSTLPATEVLAFDLAVLFGALFSSSPEISVSGPGISVTASSASATAFAWSIGGDVVVKEHFTFGLRYLQAKPKYTIKTRTELTGFQPTEDIQEVAQATSILVICVGYLF